MYKIAAIIGGVLLMAGVAMAGTMTSLGSASTPTVGRTIPIASTTVRQEDRGLAHEPGDDRGREAEARGRANEAGEDLRGACDEAEHVNDARCTGVGTAPVGDDDAADGRGDNSGSSNSGPSDRSGHEGGEDDGGQSGHGGRGGDD
jgi:hypothetical protein